MLQRGSPVKSIKEPLHGGVMRKGGKALRRLDLLLCLALHVLQGSA